MALEYAILGTLDMLGECSGYDLSQEMMMSAGNVWYADRPQIYRALAKLEEEGYVEVHPEPDNPRGRKTYTITPSGQTHLKTWLAEDYEWSDHVRNPILLKLFFSSRIDPQRVRQQIQQFRAQADAMQIGFDQAEMGIAEGAQFLPHEAIFWRMTLWQGKFIRQALLDWCDEVLRQLDDLPASPDVSFNS